MSVFSHHENTAVSNDRTFLYQAFYKWADRKRQIQDQAAKEI